MTLVGLSSSTHGQRIPHCIVRIHSVLSQSFQSQSIICNCIIKRFQFAPIEWWRMNASDSDWNHWIILPSNAWAGFLHHTRSKGQNLAQTWFTCKERTKPRCDDDSFFAALWTFLGDFGSKWVLLHFCCFCVDRCCRARARELRIKINLTFLVFVYWDLRELRVESWRQFGPRHLPQQH